MQVELQVACIGIDGLWNVTIYLVSTHQAMGG